MSDPQAAAPAAATAASPPLWIRELAASAMPPASGRDAEEDEDEDEEEEGESEEEEDPEAEEGQVDAAGLGDDSLAAIMGDCAGDLFDPYAEEESAEEDGELAASNQRRDRRPRKTERRAVVHWSHY